MAVISADKQHNSFHHYLDIAPEIHRTDWTFFERNQHRSFCVRDPYPGELKAPHNDQLSDGEHRIVVVRESRPSSFERRLFKVDIAYSDFVSALDVFRTNDEEIVGLGLWALSDDHAGGFNLHETEVSVVIDAIIQLRRSSLWWWRLKEKIELA